MSDEITWKVNGVDLDQATFGLASATLWRAPIGVRNFDVTIPGRHGTIADGLPVFEKPQITIKVRTDTGPQRALEDAINNLAALLAQPNLTLTRVSGRIEASARARLVSADMAADFIVGMWAAPTAVLEIPGVFFRDAPEVAVLPPWTVDQPYMPLPHLAGSSAPIGDAIIRVKGPATGVEITDLNSKTGISWTETLADGRYLYLAPDMLQAWDAPSSEQWTPAGDDVSGGLGWPVLGPLQLWPAVTTLDTPTQVAVSATGTGRSSATGLAIRAGRCYL